jgi:hypothetical protein
MSDKNRFFFSYLERKIAQVIEETCTARSFNINVRINATRAQIVDEK